MTLVILIKKQMTLPNKKAWEVDFAAELRFVNVSKFQKQIFLFSFEPKDERNYFLISALASKNGSNQKK